MAQSSRPPLTDADEERFWSKVSIPSDVETGCWRWIPGSGASHGYGEISVGNRKHLAHRLAFEQVNGQIPDGLCALHRCDNRLCVNPGHIFLGTRAANSADKVAKGRQAKGEQTRFAKLNAESVRTIRRKFAERMGVDRLAALFSVSPATIYRVVNRESWRHVEAA